MHGNLIWYAAVALCVAAGSLLTCRAALDLRRRGAGFLGDDLRHELARQFVFVSSRHLLLMSTLLGAVSAMAVYVLLRSMPLSLLATAVSICAPRLYIGVLRTRRRRRLGAQLPDALALWAGLLRAGQGVSQGLVRVAERQTAPLGDELRLLLRQYRMGMSLEQGMQELQDRVKLPDLGMLSTVLKANRELGGNLAESLQRLSELMRSRLAMEARIRSLTSQGRLQGWIVGLLPLFLLLVLRFMEPESIRLLVTRPAGWAALGVIAALELSGFLLIRRIVSIEV
jgi:tight adherence protein B